jgi:hypothetical protein
MSNVNLKTNAQTTELACSPAATAQRALKMHLRLLPTKRGVYSVLTLRSGIDVQFASNYYHNTWHILTDHIGASVLARLWWALSFDRHDNLLIVISGAHVVQNPFDDEPRKMLVFCNGSRTFIDDDVLRAVAALCRSGAPSLKTVPLRTHGMALVERAEQNELAGGDKRPWNRRMGRGPYARDERKVWMQEIVEARVGAVVYRAPAAVLRTQALRIAKMATWAHPMFAGMPGGRTTHEYLAAGRGLRQPLGEVQIFTRFRDMVSAAKRAEPLVDRNDDAFAVEMQEHYARSKRLAVRHRAQARKLRRRARVRGNWRNFVE